MRISDWSSDVCSSDLGRLGARAETIGAWLGVQPARRPRARAGHGRGLACGAGHGVSGRAGKAARAAGRSRVSRGIDAGSAPRPVGAYPHARRVGNLLLLSGIGPRDPASNAVPGNEHDADGKLVAHDIAAQTRAVFANVRAVLGASGARWEDLVDVNVSLTDTIGRANG